MRVTDSMVSDWLIWARNFGEVAAYKVGKGSNRRRVRVRLTPGITRNGRPFRPREGLFDLLGHEIADVVPAELMLTAREALVFGYGCAVGRAAALAGVGPEWREDGWSVEDRRVFEERLKDARRADREEFEAELREHEEERQRRVAEYRRRREEQAQIEETSG